jgi:hypothetical protein
MTQVADAEGSEEIHYREADGIGSGPIPRSARTTCCPTNPVPPTTATLISGPLGCMT